MARFYQPDLGSEPDSPFARDANNKLVRRGYWLDMNDRSSVFAGHKDCVGVTHQPDVGQAQPARRKEIPTNSRVPGSPGMCAVSVTCV